MAKTVADVMKMVKENEVKFVDFRFTDTRGKEHHVSVPVSHFDEDKFASGHAFDGSSIAGFSLHPGGGAGGVFFVPGFPVMAWPMIEWVLDGHCAAAHRAVAVREKSVIVYGSMEATLTPLMQDIEARFAGIKVFSLPSVDHPQWGRHIELGVKGEAAALDAAYAELLAGLRRQGVELGPELVR